MKSAATKKTIQCSGCVMPVFVATRSRGGRGSGKVVLNAKPDERFVIRGGKAVLALTYSEHRCSDHLKEK